MTDNKDFSFFESQNSFDFKGFIIKITSYWKWFLLSLIITFTIAYQVNLRKEKVYEMQTSIAIKEENNPFFTSTTSLVFNWGGTSDQVQNILNTLKSRSHNELVVEKLKYYVDYVKKGKYNYQDVYGSIPFYISFDQNSKQLFNSLINIKFINDSEYEMRLSFEGKSAPLVNYSDNSKSEIAVVPGEFVKRFKVGQQVNLPFLKFRLELMPNPGFYKGNDYYFRFNEFDEVVAKYQSIKVDIDNKAPSILRLSLQGTNKARMVDYLNATVKMLISVQLERKNQFATNTISFIDSTLVSMGKELKETGDALKAFHENKNVLSIQDEGSGISGQLLELEVQRDAINRKISYYNTLKTYLKNSMDYSKLPAPTVAGIDDPNILINVSKLIEFSTKRSELAYSVKSEKIFRDFDIQMESVKRVLLENINSVTVGLKYDLLQINNKINGVESNIKKLPEEKQEYLKIVRKYDLSDNIYNTFLQKRNEAEIVKAANLSIQLKIPVVV